MIEFPKNVEPAHTTRDPLANLISADRSLEILSHLKGAEILIAYCRCVGFPDDVPAYILGVQAYHISRIMNTARKRLAAELPSLRVALEGRRQAPTHNHLDPNPAPADLNLAYGPKTKAGQPPAWKTPRKALNW